MDFRVSQALWIAKKNQCCALIKKISDHYGGDDIEWLREYCKDIIQKNKDDIQKLLSCLIEMESQLRYT